MKRAVFAALALSFWATGVHAVDIYRQDFQDATAADWAASGRGDIRLSDYQGNISLKFAGHAQSLVSVEAKGLRNVIVRSKIAALGLGPADGCYAEVSPDDGATWLTALSVHKGQDSGTAQVSGAFANPRLDGRAKLFLRFRADLSQRNATCWGDDVAIIGDAPVPMQTLDLATLSGDTPLAGLARVSAFMPGADAMPISGTVRGTLELRPQIKPDGMVIISDLDSARTVDSRATWPALSIALVNDGDRLIPSGGGPVPSANADWEWVVAPGKIWMQPGDNGLVRAVLPVALQERNANCLHNGRLLVLFDPKGGASKAVAQFDQETCAYFKFDAWSRVPASFQPAEIAAADALITRDRAERASRVPLKPLSALRADYPDIDIDALARAAGPFAVFGIDDGDTHYVAPCPTRAGDDPLCDERHLPSFSTAKTLVAALSLFRLEKLHPGAAFEKIADHVPACAQKGGWGDVRLIDMLDMTSGHYNSVVANADEDSVATVAFFTSQTAEQKVDFACSVPRQEAPGKTWVYHTFDTFLLGVAMTDIIRKNGLGDDIYDDLIHPIWRALNQSAALDTTRRTYDETAQPFTGWGLTYHRDDVVRAARFLKGDAKIDGQSYFDATLLNEGMQRAKPGAGKQALAPNIRYYHGIWARDVGLLVGYGQPVWAPYMSGFGGISVVMLPNGVTFYAYNDDNHFDWTAAVAEGNKIRKLLSMTVLSGFASRPAAGSRHPAVLSLDRRQ
ncbi:serine hydrolase [Rhizobium leguminosarum]|uniref:serine hydrolase n=1 Tax=Rhizobium leguminosarum TaxID=384 RepID=UPI001AE597C3|nr:serine hydrolase [Rhizobium leguminosarum]MBP2444187.1 hypothetical protein [Rhizobium leguminosarum]